MLSSNIRRFLTSVGLIIGIMAYPQLSIAQAVHSCASHADMIGLLAETYSEKLSALGLINQKTIIEVYVGENGSWTMLVTNVSGISCMVLSGESWQAILILPGTRTGYQVE